MTDQKLFVLEDDAVPPTDDDPPDMMDRYYEVEKECAARCEAVEAALERRVDILADLEEINEILNPDMQR